MAETANVDDTSIPLAVEMGEADEQIGESRVGTVENKSWGFHKFVWIGGALFVGTVIAALVFEWSSATKSSEPFSMASEPAITNGATIMLKSSLTENYYLHVSDGNSNDGAPVVYTDSTTPGSQWQVELVGGSDTMIMLKNLRSGFYLHVKAEEQSSSDPVYQKDSTSDGSKWQVESGAPFGTTTLLKNVRSGNYLTATERSKKTCCDPVFHVDSATDGSKWILESTSTSSATPAPAPMTPSATPAPAPMTPSTTPSTTPAPAPTTCSYKFIVLKSTGTGAEFNVAEIEFERSGFAVTITSATSPQGSGSPGTPGSAGPEDAIDETTDTAWRGVGVPAELELTIDQCASQPDQFRLFTDGPGEPLQWTMQQLVDGSWKNVNTRCADFIGWHADSRPTATQWFPLLDGHEIVAGNVPEPAAC